MYTEEKMKTIIRKSLLYKTGVEYGNYTANHVLGCYHGCHYPCYAQMLAKRFGKVKSYDEWIQPQLVSNALDLLDKELPKLRKKITFVNLCFTTDPFMMEFPEVSEMTIQMINKINEFKIKCMALTKGILPKELEKTQSDNEYGVSLITLNEDFRKAIEPNASNINDRIESMKYLHQKGFRTWVSIEPYPTPNIFNQDLQDILKAVEFTDKIIFGRLHYNKLVAKYKGYQEYYNKLSHQVIDFCEKRNIDWHIKEGTMFGIREDV